MHYAYRHPSTLVRIIALLARTMSNTHHTALPYTTGNIAKGEGYGRRLMVQVMARMNPRAVTTSLSHAVNVCCTTATLRWHTAA